MELNSFNGQNTILLAHLAKKTPKKTPLFLAGFLILKLNDYLITFLVTVTPSWVVI
jgi:hypothetical protein